MIFRARVLLATVLSVLPLANEQIPPPGPAACIPAPSGLGCSPVAESPPAVAPDDVPKSEPSAAPVQTLSAIGSGTIINGAARTGFIFRASAAPTLTPA
jgi:hypothetical protein